MGRKECCIWDLVGSACVEAEIGENLMLLLLLLFHVLHVLLTASMLSHPWWQDSTICGALFATEIYIHSPWLKRWKRYIGLTLEHTLIHCILYYFFTQSQTSNGVFTTPIIDVMKGNVTFHWAHENKYTLLFFTFRSIIYNTYILLFCSYWKWMIEWQCDLPQSQLLERGSFWISHHQPLPRFFQLQMFSFLSIS